MPRAMGCFRKAGFAVEAWPVDYRTPRRLDLTHWNTLHPRGPEAHRLRRARVRRACRATTWPAGPTRCCLGLTPAKARACRAFAASVLLADRIGRLAELGIDIDASGISSRRDGGCRRRAWRGRARTPRRGRAPCSMPPMKGRTTLLAVTATVGRADLAIAVLQPADGDQHRAGGALAVHQLFLLGHLVRGRRRSPRRCVMAVDTCPSCLEGRRRVAGQRRGAGGEQRGGGAGGKRASMGARLVDSAATLANETWR